MPSSSAQYTRCLPGDGIALGLNPGRTASPVGSVPASGKSFFFYLVPQELRTGSLLKDGRSGCSCYFGIFDTISVLRNGC